MNFSEFGYIIYDRRMAVKIRSRLFVKSFLLSLVIFVLLAAIIVTSLYMDKTALLPTQRETTVLVGIIDGDSVVSLAVLCADPQKSEIKLLPVPDNTIVDGKILQEQYKREEADTLLEYLSGIVGRNIDRYLLISADALESSVNTVGTFTYFIQYQFLYSGRAFGGTYSKMNGELVRAMLTYGGYDRKSVSVSTVSMDFFTYFMTKYSAAADFDEIYNVIERSVSGGESDTNLTGGELAEYLELLSKYSEYTHITLTMSGKTDGTSSEINYFIPESLHSETDIFN